MSDLKKKLYFPKIHEYSSVKSRWENWAEDHKGRQITNPFSEGYTKDVHKIPSKADQRYGRPRIGSKTEYRGKKADIHISEEVVGLCEAIVTIGEDLEDGTVLVEFGTLFKYYCKLSFNVVGLLIRARKRGYLEFRGEMLYQGQDDEEPILLYAKPYDLVNEIREMKKDLSMHSSIGKKY